MPEQRRKVRIDRAVYLVNDDTKTYSFIGRNHSWKDLPQGENKENKKSIDGYTRIFRNDKSKVFRYGAT
jgi:hypothetical protein